MKWDGTDETSLAIREWIEPAAAVVDTDHIQHLWDYDTGCYILPSGKTVFAPLQRRCLIILTLEGEMVAAIGWQIIKGVQGEFYPCDPDIFAATYDAVEITREVHTYGAEPVVETIGEA